VGRQWPVSCGCISGDAQIFLKWHFCVCVLTEDGILRMFHLLISAWMPTTVSAVFFLLFLSWPDKCHDSTSMWPRRLPSRPFPYHRSTTRLQRSLAISRTARPLSKYSLILGTLDVTGHFWQRFQISDKSVYTVIINSFGKSPTTLVTPVLSWTLTQEPGLSVHWPVTYQFPENQATVGVNNFLFRSFNCIVCTWQSICPEQTSGIWREM
jgi:hypothetical protein